MDLKIQASTFEATKKRLTSPNRFGRQYRKMFIQKDQLFKDTSVEHHFADGFLYYWFYVYRTCLPVLR